MILQTDSRTEDTKLERYRKPDASHQPHLLPHSILTLRHGSFFQSLVETLILLPCRIYSLILVGVNSLWKNPHIIIRPADKGGAVVVLDRELYNKQVFAMLSELDT